MGRERQHPVTQQQHETVEWISRKEAAELVGVSLPTISNWMKAGHFPHFKLGGAVRIRRDDFDAFVARSRRQGGAA